MVSASSKVPGQSILTGRSARVSGTQRWALASTSAHSGILIKKTLRQP
ncbi:Uncharacterised protein [Serratia rubidaea]|uniref:Uncharacterized protein n=1 Tax=Serratia rubidaea TaxID=61652 RepID=A0A3S4FT80_SERRU|nr:Uncharacterised protein [Serratia rubidaea]